MTGDMLTQVYCVCMCVCVCVCVCVCACVCECVLLICAVNPYFFLKKKKSKRIALCST